MCVRTYQGLSEEVASKVQGPHAAVNVLLAQALSWKACSNGLMPAIVRLMEGESCGYLI